MIDCFLSVDDSEPLGIFLGHDRGFDILLLNDFFNQSKILMPTEMAERYAKEFERFANELRSIG